MNYLRLWELDIFVEKVERVVWAEATSAAQESLDSSDSEFSYDGDAVDSDEESEDSSDDEVEVAAEQKQGIFRRFSFMRSSSSSLAGSQGASDSGKSKNTSSRKKKDS